MKAGFQQRTKNSQTSQPVQTRMLLRWVQCRGYNCLAYTDAAGKWINFYTGEKLTDFVKVIG